MKIKSMRTLFLKDREKLALGQVLVGELKDFSENIQQLIKEKSPYLEVIKDAPKIVKKEIVKVEPVKKELVKVEVEVKKVAKPKTKKLIKKTKK